MSPDPFSMFPPTSPHLLSSALCVGTGATQEKTRPTFKAEAAEVELGRVRHGADVAREREAFVDFDLAAVCLEHANGEGQLSCTRDSLVKAVVLH